MGEGIIIIHPDTGWTSHPELWDDRTIVDGALADDRYLTRKSKNFIDPEQPAMDRLYTPGLKVLTATDMGLKGRAKYFVKPVTTLQIRHPSHGTATASVMISKKGRPSYDEYSAYYDVFPGQDLHFVSGVAPLAKALPCKVSETVILSAQASIDLAKCIHYAVQLSKSSTAFDPDGAQIGVISISLGGLDSMAQKPSLVKAIKAAKEAGIVVVAAAGQFTERTGKYGSPVYPANDPNTICVAACNSTHGKYIKGFYGSSVDISAPGDKIWQARAKRVPNALNDYFVDQSDGTSYSAAFVAGACALWQAHHGRQKLLDVYGVELIFDLFKKALLDSCDTPANWDTANRGAGVLDAEKLLLEPLPSKSEMEAISGG